MGTQLILRIKSMPFANEVNMNNRGQNIIEYMVALLIFGLLVYAFMKCTVPPKHLLMNIPVYKSESAVKQFQRALQEHLNNY